jgi:hypothetical protein
MDGIVHASANRRRLLPIEFDSHEPINQLALLTDLLFQWLLTVAFDQHLQNIAGT